MSRPCWRSNAGFSGAQSHPRNWSSETCSQSLSSGSLGSDGEIHRHDEGRASGLGQVGPAPFLAAGDEAEVEPEFTRDLGGAVGHQGAAGLEGGEHLPVRGGRERFERGIELGPFAALRMLLIISVIERIVARVEEALPHGGDDAHERARIGALIAGVRLEHDMLEDIGLDDDVVGVLLRQGDQGAGAADDPFGRDDHARGESQRAQRRQGLVFGRVVSHCPVFRRDLGHRVAGAAAARIGLRARYPEEPKAGRSQAGRRRGLDLRGGNGRIGAAEHEIGINEPGVKGRAFHVPNARIRRGRNRLSDRLDEPVPNHNGSPVEDFTGPDHDLAADQGMNAERERAEAGSTNFAGRDTARRKPDRQSDYGEEPDGGTNYSAAHAGETIGGKGRQHKAGRAAWMGWVQYDQWSKSPARAGCAEVGKHA